MTTPLVDFYAGKSPDSRGRMLTDIQAWGFAELENAHDYIQWLFPLRTASAFQPDAPVLDDAQIDTFRSSPDLRARLLTSLETMLRFYGFTRDGESIVRSPAWPERSANWVAPGDHNHLRLTRIMTSLSTLGLVDEARALQKALLAEAELSRGVISAHTQGYWRAAIADG